MTILKWLLLQMLLLLMLFTSLLLLLVFLLWTTFLRETDDVEAATVTNDCKGFVVLTFAVFVVDVVLAAEAAVVVTHCDLVVVLVFDAVGTYSVGVHDACVAVAFHLIISMYLALVAVLNPNRGIEIHVDVVFLVLPDLQEVLTKLLHLKNQL